MGEHSVRSWQYWPEQARDNTEAKKNIPPYCPTLKSAVISLLYDLHTALLVVLLKVLACRL